MKIEKNTSVFGCPQQIFSYWMLNNFKKFNFKSKAPHQVFNQGTSFSVGFHTVATPIIEEMIPRDPWTPVLALTFPSVFNGKTKSETFFTKSKNTGLLSQTHCTTTDKAPAFEVCLPLYVAVVSPLLYCISFPLFCCLLISNLTRFAIS